MNKGWQDIALDAILALIWFISGYFMMSVFGVADWSLYAGLINVIMGMILLLVGTRTEAGAQQLYRGLKDKEAGFSFPLFLLISIPPLCVFIGIIGWIVRLLQEFLGYK